MNIQIAELNEQIAKLSRELTNLAETTEILQNLYNTLCENYELRGKALIRSEERVRALNKQLGDIEEFYKERANMVRDFLRGNLDTLSIEEFRKSEDY